jgi:hypothetical protein
MPELVWQLGYPMALGMILIVGVVLYVLFATWLARPISRVICGNRRVPHAFTPGHADHAGIAPAALDTPT